MSPLGEFSAAMAENGVQALEMLIDASESGKPYDAAVLDMTLPLHKRHSPGPNYPQRSPHRGGTSNYVEFQGRAPRARKCSKRKDTGFPD